MTPKLSIILFTLLFAFTSSFGQSDSTVSSEISKLTKKGIDSFIHVSVPQYIYAPIKLNGIGAVVIFSVDYLFYKQKGHLVSIKIVNHCGYDCIATIVSISKIHPIKVDSLFTFINMEYKRLESEQILPFTYKYYDSTTGLESFHTLRTSHPAFYQITIRAGKESFSKPVYLDDLLLKRWEDAPANLNYANNNKTKLSLFVNILTRLIEIQDSQFNF